MSTDILEDLRRLRPDLDELGRQWPVSSRAELADRIRATVQPDAGNAGRLSPGRLSRRRVVVGSMLVAAAVAAAVTVPALLPADAPGAAGPAAAAALDRLARVAAAAPADVAGPGRFVHLVVQERRTGTFGAPHGTPSTLTDTRETWTGSRGQLWVRQPGAETMFFPAHDGDAAYLASLPTDATELNSYLRTHASGSDSIDEAVFVAVGDLLRGGNVPAALRSAAVTVLAHTDHVTLGPATSDGHGRAVEEFDFADPSQRPGVVDSLFLDPATAALLDERTTGPAGSSTSAVLQSGVVDAVPADVVRTAVRQK